MLEFGICTPYICRCNQITIVFIILITYRYEHSNSNVESGYIKLYDAPIQGSNRILCRAVPLRLHQAEFTWTSGHSGQVLSEDVANRLETLWFDYLYLNPRLNNGTSAAANIRNVNLISPILRRYLNASRGNNCEKCNYNYQKYGAKIANSKTLTVARCRLRNSGEKTATTSCIMCTAFAETVTKPSCMAVAT